jgi:hypothetical protein
MIERAIPFHSLDVVGGKARENYPMVPGRSFLGSSSANHWRRIDAATGQAASGNAAVQIERRNCSLE